MYDEYLVTYNPITTMVGRVLLLNAASTQEKMDRFYKDLGIIDYYHNYITLIVESNSNDIDNIRNIIINNFKNLYKT